MTAKLGVASDGTGPFAGDLSRANDGGYVRGHATEGAPMLLAIAATFFVTANSGL